MTHFTQKLLTNLPPIPSELLNGYERWESTMPNKFDGVLTGSRRANRKGEVVKTAIFTKYQAPDNIVKWIREHIADDYSDVGITYTKGSTDHLPHTDLWREYAINFLIETGGDNVSTDFYSDGVEPLRKDNGVAPEDLDALTLVDNVIVPKFSWFALDSRVIHGVSNIETTRIQIGLSFKYFPEHLIK
jgi:hypothetical protein